MSTPLFGIETEYALVGFGPGGTNLPGGQAAGALMEAAWQHLPHLRDARSGMFLVNGARLYLDTGSHPEFATPECTDPAELVRQVLAGHRILQQLGCHVEVDCRGIDEVLVLASNVDYSGSRATWGCHESYLHRVDPITMAEEIGPHLVSRVIFTGAGGFDPLSPGLVFTLSPRAHHLELAESTDSTRSRGIVHAKNEPLASWGYRRLHLICGESLRSERGTWLKAGTTALVVAMIDAGGRPGASMLLADPVSAMRAFATDPGCQVRVPLQSGGTISAVELQMHYLEHVERYLSHAALPGWAEEVCREWRRALEDLGSDPAALSSTLDWVIKRAVYTEFLRKRGFTWGSVRCWNVVRASLSNAWWRAGQGWLPNRLDAVLDKHSPVRPAVDRLGRLLNAWGQSWESAEAFDQVRRDLFELDTRYAQIGERSLFEMLDAKGVLQHRLPGAGSVEAAMQHAPAAGRAHVRGEWVKRLAANRDRYQCDWAGIWDLHDPQVLSLADPFARHAAWQRLGSRAEQELISTGVFAP